MVNRGDRYIDGEEGMELKKGNRVMALEDSSARVEYYLGATLLERCGET